MAVNPAKQGATIDSPIERANKLNDPQFENQQGYFPYDLTHSELLSPRFGEVTPSMHLDTVPADRIVVKDDTKTIHNQINANFLSTLNQYIDSFYVPMRSLFPNNWDKLIVNPTKGNDLPNSALPQFPLSDFIYDYLFGTTRYRVLFMVDNSETGGVDPFPYDAPVRDLTNLNYLYHVPVLGWAISRMLFLSTILSRGQLLDYLGIQLDFSDISKMSRLQYLIDKFQRTLYNYLITSAPGDNLRIWTITPNVFQNEIDLSEITINKYYDLSISDDDPATNALMSEYRSVLSDIFERGDMPIFDIFVTETDISNISFELIESYQNLYSFIEDGLRLNTHDLSDFINDINTESAPFRKGFINIAKPLAYQQIIAQYYSNNSVDNIFNSDLFMQLLRSVMFPAGGTGFSSEPTFVYNGVTTEYDYISCGALYYSLLTDTLKSGNINRQYVFASLMFLMRRSLRYGDYFSTARPNMLAVGQLSINVENGKVSPIDITKNLLLQRYLNAANYIGSGPLAYYNSIFGIVPSDTGTFPRFIAHRKITLQNQITNNTANDQGKQTTNLVGFSDNTGFDVFIDDLGVLMSLVSYDVLPIYTSGIDRCYSFADRFDYFNPMLQNVGDQPIYLSEMYGSFTTQDMTFGYTMRNAEYKFKVSRAHGAFVNSLPGHILTYPLSMYVTTNNLGTYTNHIDSDFIRDKPVYMDSVVPKMTGISPGEYFHFVVSVVNQVQCARKIQATPPVLF